MPPLRANAAARSAADRPSGSGRASSYYRPGTGDRGACQRIAWDDPSGARLRVWTGLDAARFYDPEQVAFMPMGFCYPGKIDGGGDAPPRPECAPLWHARLRAELGQVRLTLLVGHHAQRAYLHRPGTMTEAVRSFATAPAGLFALPHPSWRSTGWMRRNPWFEVEVVPALQARIAAAFS